MNIRELNMKKITDNQVIDIHISNIAKTLETVGLVSKQAQESYLRIAKTLDPTIKKAVQDINYASELVDKHTNWLNNNRDYFEKHNNYWQNFQKQYEITEQEAIEILKKHHWFITLSLPFDFVDQVVEIGRKEGNQCTSVDKLFEDYFTSNDFEKLDCLVKEWGKISIFESRMKIFEDCISTLRDSKNKTNPSNLIVPTLIAQIDGIQAEFMELNELSFDPQARQWKNGSGAQVTYKQLFEEQISDREFIDWSNQELLNLCNHIFFDILFQGSWRGNPVSSPFSRHKIMHGEHIDYGRIDNTIRAFMILDYLATLTNRTLSQQQ